jgi:hypothetical protein
MQSERWSILKFWRGMRWSVCLLAACSLFCLANLIWSVFGSWRIASYTFVESGNGFHRRRTAGTFSSGGFWIIAQRDSFRVEPGIRPPRNGPSTTRTRFPAAADIYLEFDFRTFTKSGHAFSSVVDQDLWYGHKLFPGVILHWEPKTTEWYTRAIAIHWGLLTLAFGIFPAIHMVRAARARQKLRENYCQNCGYDMRATPQRCPECGAGRAVPVPMRSLP